jgi:peptidoglycan/xylan/chitin deacetylase (PgdA/CDA1 family)
MTADPVRSPLYFRRDAIAPDARGTLLLMYHQVRRPHRASKLRALCVAPALLDRQLAEFRREEFFNGPLAELTQTSALATLRLGVTFDDGFVNNLTLGLPVLQRHGISAINYLVADRFGKTNDWDLVHGEPQQPLMDVAQVRDWLAAGQRIGAHTLTHPHLTRLSEADARREIFDSKRKLEDTFGVAIDDFCYPYGDFNARVRELVIEAGYRTAVSTVAGLTVPGADRYALPRYLASHRKPGWLAWCPLLPAGWV